MTKYIVTAALLLVTSTATAREPLPKEQWTPGAQLWLARAMVAEAGWTAELDHAAIAHVLARRWKRLAERWPTMRFLDVVRKYCSGLGGFHRDLTLRQRWVRELQPIGEEPEGWPRHASWSRHRPLWRAALARSASFAEGELRDPCRGKAVHWGGTIDSPRGRMVAIDCGETQNTFYALRPK